MTDYFELFSLPRLPFLSDHLLKERFVELSSRWHPDRFHAAAGEEKRSAGQRFAEINAAFHCLREPPDRLRHLLELETGTKPRDIETIPASAMNVFFEIAQTCREAAQFLEEKAAVSSPILKAKLYERGLEWAGRLRELQSQIETMRQVLLAELDAMNVVWENAPVPGSPDRAQRLPLKRLEEIYRILSYIARRTGQIEEQIVQLSF
jgi:molecular chaperone HscB